MGEITVSGDEATVFLNYLITNDVAKLNVNQVLYSPMCYPEGGVVDDLLVYRLADQKYLLIVNAANISKDVAWIAGQAEGFKVDVKNLSDSMAELALQGPMAQTILQGLTDEDLQAIRYYWFHQDVNIEGVSCLVSRTGYTGEDGFELYCTPSEAPRLWECLLRAGKPYGLVSAGLGARDTLRFEACLPLYGHELSESITPLEAGLSSFVKLEKGNFIGYAALVKQKNEGLKRKIAALAMVGRGIARAGYRCYASNQPVGTITSGTYAPTLDKNLALAIIDRNFADPGNNIDIEIRGKMVPAEIVQKPFYKRRKI